MSECVRNLNNFSLGIFVPIYIIIIIIIIIIVIIITVVIIKVE